MPHGKACSEKLWACFYLPPGDGNSKLCYTYIRISEGGKKYTVRNNNTQGKTEFITEHIFWLALAWIWYRSLLFRCVPQHTLTESKLILLGFVLVFSAVGILFQMQNNRNGMGVFLDLVLGYGAYTVLTYWPIYQRLIKICLVAAGILSLLYAALVLCRRMRSRKYALKILCKRLGLVAFMSKKIVGMSLALIMGVSGASVLFGSSLLKSDVRPATKTNLSEQTIANNMDTILLLQEDEWEKLSAQERMDVLQAVANIEQRYLGLPNELNVGVANLDADILGYYTDKTHEIIVSADSLLYDSPREVLDTICHEAYHSYQYRLVEALNGADENSKNLRIFRKAYTYADEFTSYKDGSTDFCGYYTQDCENDARDYAEDAVSDYYWRIMDHLEE